MTGRRVLITNNTLNTRFGAELVTRDLAIGLAALGEQIAVYTPKPGSVSDELRQSGIPVVSDLANVPFSPDIVHGNQHLETIEALRAYPEARGIFVCHARLGWPAVPPLTQRIQHYVAVDHNCLERLIADYRIPSEQVSIIFNSVDTERFRQRSPLPERPQRALMFSNYATEDNYLVAIRAACREIGLPLDVIGSGVGKQVDRPEEVLPNYDIVFAKARCAIEAIAVGNAVILCDEAGLGPMVRSEDVAELRKWNFGMRKLQSPIVPQRILAEIARYDAMDARLASDFVRLHSAATRLTPEYVSLYDKVMAMPRAKKTNDPDDYHENMVRKTAAFEVELYSLGKPYRMEPLTASVAAQVRLTNARVSTPLAHGSLWVECQISNGTSDRLGSYHPAPIYLGYHWFDSAGIMVTFESLRTPLIPPVDPECSQTYEIKVETPRNPGEYRLRITLVQEGIRWFDELADGSAFIDLPVKVSAADL